MEELTEKIEALTRRVQALEDELAIHRLMVRYGFAVDTGDADGTAALFTEDTVYDVDVGVMRGRDGIRQMVRGDMHQSLLPNCAHMIGPAVVQLDSSRAVATGYSRVYLRQEDGIKVYRVSFNRWELQRRRGEWQVAHRTTRVLGHEEAHALLRQR